jgi:acyl carrier protein
MKQHADIVSRLLTLTRERFGEKADRLSPGDDLYEVLQIDSMEAMDLLTALEDTFEVEIPDYELQGVRTLSSIAGLIERRL